MKGSIEVLLVTFLLGIVIMCLSIFDSLLGKEISVLLQIILGVVALVIIIIDAGGLFIIVMLLAFLIVAYLCFALFERVLDEKPSTGNVIIICIWVAAVLGIGKEFLEKFMSNLKEKRKIGNETEVESKNEDVNEGEDERKLKMKNMSEE